MRLMLPTRHRQGCQPPQCNVNAYRAPKISPTHEHDDSSRPLSRVRVGGAQTFALRGIQRAVVEVKMQIADRAAFLVAYFRFPCTPLPSDGAHRTSAARPPMRRARAPRDA